MCLIMLTGICDCNDATYIPAMQTKQDAIKLAQQLKGLDPDYRANPYGAGPSLADEIIVAAEDLGDAIVSYCKTGKTLPPFQIGEPLQHDLHHYVVIVQNMGGIAYGRIIELAGNPDVPSDSYFSQTFSNVHGSTGDQ
jgi:hypothetical protein